ncbi:MAG: peptidoglycan-binding protein [Myxococcales bacterium]|nr:peptidoglycan-binding protein [Myxococcales bacterium]MDH3842621.1 peptidoglycan-binding protein [Myxococcales bacterium]
MKRLIATSIVIGSVCALAYGLVIELNDPARAQDAKAQAGTSADLPPAKPGECYARLWVPASYEDQSESVQVREASERIETIPARYEWRTEKIVIQEEGEKLIPVPAKYKKVAEKVLIKEASETIKVIPAKYEMRTEKVAIKEGGEKLISIPAKYDMVEEKVLVKAGYTTWKKGKGAYQRVDNATGEIMCLVEVPPVYKTMRKRVLVSPATTKTVAIKPTYKTVRKRVLVEPARVVRKEIPAEYRTISKIVLSEPATTKSVAMPAKYQTIRKYVMVEPPSSRTIEIPAENRDITRKVKIADGSMQWKAILCETNANRSTIASIQQALRKNDFKVARTGRLDARTMAALEEFQRKEGLTAGQLTMETLDALGVSH